MPLPELPGNQQIPRPGFAGDDFREMIDALPGPPGCDAPASPPEVTRFPVGAALVPGGAIHGLEPPRPDFSIPRINTPGILAWIGVCTSCG